jgi:hypothetical protein
VQSSSPRAGADRELLRRASDQCGEGRIASAEVKTASSCSQRLKTRDTGTKRRSHSSLGFDIDLTNGSPFAGIG